MAKILIHYQQNGEKLRKTQNLKKKYIVIMTQTRTNLRENNAKMKE